MRIRLAASIALALAAGLSAEDKVAKTPAPQLLVKVVPELKKATGYHFSYTGSIGENSLETTGVVWQNGVIKQVAKDGMEIWRREKAAFARDKDGKLVGAASLGRQAQAITTSPSPDQLLAEAMGVAKVAKYVQDEEAGGKECKVIECEAPEAKLRDYMEQAAKYWAPEMAKMAKNIQLDQKESYMIYRIFVSKDDLVIRRVVRDTKVKVAESVLKAYPMAAQAEGGMSQVLTVELSAHGEVADDVIPDDVKRVLQVK